MKYEMLEFRPQNPALAIYTEANKIVLQGPSDWIISTIMEVQTLNSQGGNKCMYSMWS